MKGREMGDDGSLFPPFSNPTTSREAAAAKLPTAETDRRRVYELIQESGKFGKTDDEIQMALWMSQNTETPRRWELVNQGLITETRRRRKTRCGKGAIVWVTCGNLDDESRPEPGGTQKRKRSKFDALAADVLELRKRIACDAEPYNVRTRALVALDKMIDRHGLSE